MQQLQLKEEEPYADGFAEYESFYGGPAFNYLAPAKSASAVQELPAKPVHNRTLATSRYASSYPHDLAANAPLFKKEAGGRQLASPCFNYGAPPIYTQGLQVDTRCENPNMGYSMSPSAPAPLNYVHKAPGDNRHLYRFPQAPSSPGLQQQPTHALQPAPLLFPKQSSTLPPTPPMSFGSSASNEDCLPERMQSLHVSDQYMDDHNYPASPPKFSLGALPRMNTMSSMSSGRSSSHVLSPAQSIPASPFTGEQSFPFSASSRSSLPVETPEMSPSDAQADVLRRLSSKDDTSNRKGSTSSTKKGFSIRKTNTTTKGANSPSQDDLTDVLEEVALKGNLSLVKAVIDLGADPVYRSTGKLKKVKHEALQQATIHGRAKVVDFLLQKGASYGETQKKTRYTSLDRVLLAAVYKGHIELATCLIASHGANPMVEQWPREMYDTQHYWAENQVRLSKTSVLDGVSKWKNADQGMSLLKLIMQNHNLDPTALVSGVFDTKSELQTAELCHKPWQTTYEYSVLACFVKAGWADAVEELLRINGTPKDYEKEDEVLQYQDKVTRYVTPVNALAKDTWGKRPEDALRILRLLLERTFQVNLVQRTATDMGQRTALGRALSADAAQGVELILQNKPSLVREEISFRRNKKETKALPLAAALSLGSLETARVLLRAGAHPRDPAFEDMNVLQFAAQQGGETATAILAEMIEQAPEATYDALNIAIKRTNTDGVRVLLDSISAAALRQQIAALPHVYDMLLDCANTEKDDTTKEKYVRLIDMVVAWDAGCALQRPQLPAILLAIRKDNYVGMEHFLKLGVIDGKSLVLNSKAKLHGEQGLWTMLECCELTNRSSEWLGLLRYYGAPLYQ